MKAVNALRMIMFVLQASYLTTCSCSHERKTPARATFLLHPAGYQYRCTTLVTGRCSLWQAFVNSDHRLKTIQMAVLFKNLSTAWKSVLRGRRSSILRASRPPASKKSRLHILQQVLYHMKSGFLPCRRFT